MAMRKLDTIQKREQLNEVYAIDTAGPGNASHRYVIVPAVSGNANQIARIVFQCGPRNDENSISGVIDTDLLEIVRDRLIGFQAGQYACKYNEMALTHIEDALKILNQRIEDRIDRDVLGTYSE